MALAFGCLTPLFAILPPLPPHLVIMAPPFVILVSPLVMMAPRFGLYWSNLWSPTIDLHLGYDGTKSFGYIGPRLWLYWRQLWLYLPRLQLFWPSQPLVTLAPRLLILAPPLVMHWPCLCFYLPLPLERSSIQHPHSYLSCYRSRNCSNLLILTHVPSSQHLELAPSLAPLP